MLIQPTYHFFLNNFYLRGTYDLKHWTFKLFFKESLSIRAFFISCCFFKMIFVNNTIIKNWIFLSSAQNCNPIIEKPLRANLNLSSSFLQKKRQVSMLCPCSMRSLRVYRISIFHYKKFCNVDCFAKIFCRSFKENACKLIKRFHLTDLYISVK